MPDTSDKRECVCDRVTEELVILRKLALAARDFVDEKKGGYDILKDAVKDYFLGFKG